LLTNKVKNTFLSLYEFYLKVDEVVDDNMHKQGVNAFDDAEIDVNTLAQFKRHLQIEDGVENRNKIERYLFDNCEDHNDDMLYILG
jgi:hypothetical protein